MQNAIAQDVKATYTLTLEEAVKVAKEDNDNVKIAHLRNAVAVDELKEIKSHVLPHVVVQGSGKRLSNVTLYESGLGSAESLPPPPSSYQASAGIETSFNLYSGGRHEAAIRSSETKKKILDIAIEQQQGNIALQVVTHYLEILRLSELDSLYDEQLKKDRLRVKNINSLYKNGKVTRSDVLRAEISLSDQEYAIKENESEIQIFHNRLNVLLHLPQETKVILADTTIVNSISLTEEVLETDSQNAYPFKMAEKEVDLREHEIKAARSNYYPSVELIAAYGYNYPNYLRYPYVDQVYSIGFVGFRMQYSLSSLYQNNHKVSAEKNRLEEARTQKSATQDNINLEISSLKIKMEDMQAKIALAQKNIEQSKVNYKIVSAKYFNQLALLTDLLDADNLYLQSKYSLIEAKNQLLNYYYQLLFTTGKL
jgi:outer membrane protein TolC